MPLQTAPMRMPAVLTMMILASCDAAPSTVQSSDGLRPGDNERTISGVLTLYTEGSSFHECSLREPWKCLLSEGPECGFDAKDGADRVIDAAIARANAYQGFARFGVVMVGVRVDGVISGHLNAYDCEFRARSVLKVYEVQGVRPPPAE